MKARAIQRNIHLSPRKAKLVCDLIRNKKVTDALTILEHVNKKAAPIISKLLSSALANATNNHAMNAEKLYIYHIVANQGSTLKRTSPRAKGSADLIRKRHCHIEIIVSDDINERQKDLDEIKKLKSKRAANNKGYSAKQRAGLLKAAKKAKKDSPKSNAKKEQPVAARASNTKAVEMKSNDPEAAKREKQNLKYVDHKNGETTPIIIISASPKHANLLLDDSSKNVLFYKLVPTHKIERVLVYATAPVSAVVGEFDLEDIKVGPTADAWNKFGEQSVLNKKEFDDFYYEKNQTHALIASKTYRYNNPKSLSDFGMTKGPYGFQYLK